MGGAVFLVSSSSSSLCVCLRPRVNFVNLRDDRGSRPLPASLAPPPSSFLPSFPSPPSYSPSLFFLPFHLRSSLAVIYHRPKSCPSLFSSFIAPPPSPLLTPPSFLHPFIPASAALAIPGKLTPHSFPKRGYGLF